MSGSIRYRRVAIDFIVSVVEDLEVSANKTRVAVVYYSDTAHQLFNFGDFNSKQDIIYWIKKTPYLGGRTNSAAALRLMVIFVYNVFKKKHPLMFSIITPSFLSRFLYFLHYWKEK